MFQTHNSINTEIQRTARSARGSFAIIDIGSNSIRLCIFSNAGKQKFVETTQLGESFHPSLCIAPIPLARSLSALQIFAQICKDQNISHIFPFATAVVREAKNREDFLVPALKMGLDIHILSGKEEALCGFLGACSLSSPSPNPSAILDIGGASFEIAVGNASSWKGLFHDSIDFPTPLKIREKSMGTLDFSTLSFAHSFKVGAVRTTDMFGENFQLLASHTNSLLADCPNLPDFSRLNCFGIGGTITSLCGLSLKTTNYDEKLHGANCSFSTISTLVDHIQSLSPLQRDNLPFLKPKRKKIIASGGEILRTAMQHLNINSITPSLNDNLEGYAIFLGIL